MDLRINELLELQPGLSCTGNIIEGKICVEIHDKGFYINNTYYIKIIVDLKSPFLSKVYETNRAVKKEYKHKYPDGMLCLSTPIDLKIAETKDCSLVKLYTDYIEPYFFSYEFYERYGYFPFDDREHGVIGIMDSYRDITGIDDSSKLLLLLNNIYYDKYKYRGHLPCPCGSNYKTRNCHPGIKDLFLNKSITQQAKMDYYCLELAFDEHKKEAKH